MPTPTIHWPNIVYSGTMYAAQSGLGHVRASCIRAAVINAKIHIHRVIAERCEETCIRSARTLHAQINQRYGNQTVKICIYHPKSVGSQTQLRQRLTLSTLTCDLRESLRSAQQSPDRLSRVRLNSNWFRIHSVGCWCTCHGCIEIDNIYFDSIHYIFGLRLKCVILRSHSLQCKLNSRICFTLICDFVLNERIHCLRLPHTRFAYIFEIVWLPTMIGRHEQGGDEGRGVSCTKMCLKNLSRKSKFVLSPEKSTMHMHLTRELIKWRWFAKGFMAPDRRTCINSNENR